MIHSSSKMSNVVQLEAFEAPLHTRRIRWFLAPGSPAAYPPGFVEQVFTESPPFTKRILLTSHASTEAWKLVDRWDIIFCPSTSADWSLILTIITHQQAPVLVVATPELKIPPIIYQKCSQQGAKAPLIVQLATLSLPATAAAITFDATFFPPSKLLEDSVLEATQASLAQTISSNAMQGFVLKDAIRDLKGAGASIVVSCIGEAEPCLYWYYATEQKNSSNDIITSVIRTLSMRA
jgi:hypothetical protein